MKTIIFIIFLASFVPVFSQESDETGSNIHFITIPLRENETVYVFQLIDSSCTPSTLWLYAHDDILEFIGDSDEAGDFPFSAIGAYASPDMRYIAVTRVGEGHTWAEIVDIRQVLYEKRYDVIQEIMPYPGNLDIVRWDKSGLLIESDIDLTQLNEKQRIELSAECISPAMFVYDIEERRFHAR